MPLHALAWQALGTAGFVAAGGLRTRAGRTGLLLSAASAAGLIGLDRVAGQAADLLEAALVDELGDEYRSLMAPEMAPPLSSPITRRQIVNPVPQLRRRYATARDVSYGEMGRRNQLDVWRRADLPLDGKAPVLVQVHGGAWMTGNKEQQGAALMAHLAERGWVCVAVNYRLSPKATWPDHIVDVKRALAWVKEHIAEHGGDPDFVAITGGSAGGHLSSLAALTPNVAAFQPGFEDVDTTVQAAVPFYGVYDFTNRDGSGRADMEADARPHGLQVEAGRLPRGVGAGQLDELGRPRRAAVLRHPRHQRQPGAGRAGPVVLAHAAGGVERAGRLRRAAPGPARLRHHLVGAHPRHGRGGRPLPRLRPHRARHRGRRRDGRDGRPPTP